jgi:AcrR family transcriptional regulator
VPARRFEQPKERPEGLREAQRQFTIRHIIEAAVDVFSTKGYLSTTIEDIIEQAGTSRRTFYTYFRSKGDILVRVASEVLPEIRANYVQLDDVLETGSEEALREWLRATIEHAERYGHLTTIWEQAAAAEPERQTERRDFVLGYPDLMPKYLKRWPTARREEARLRIVLMSVQLDRYLSNWPPRTLGDRERARLLDVLTEIWSIALRPPTGR